MCPHTATAVLIQSNLLISLALSGLSLPLSLCLSLSLTQYLSLSLSFCLCVHVFVCVCLFVFVFVCVCVCVCVCVEAGRTASKIDEEIEEKKAEIAGTDTVVKPTTVVVVFVHTPICMHARMYVYAWMHACMFVGM